MRINVKWEHITVRRVVLHMLQENERKFIVVVVVVVLDRPDLIAIRKCLNFFFGFVYTPRY